MRKISKKKLYGAIVNAGIFSSTVGVGTFMANYFAYDKMYPGVTIASIGVTTVGILSAFYGLQKQFNTPEDEDNEERERDLIHEALYNPELLKRQRKELKIVESRFVREEELMDEEYSSILRFNLYKEKLMIKKALEAENTDNPVLEQECDLIVEIINRQGFDDEYLEYRSNVINNHVIDLPIRDNCSMVKQNKNAQVLDFKRKQ